MRAAARRAAIMIASSGGLFVSQTLPAIANPAPTPATPNPLIPSRIVANPGFEQPTGPNQAGASVPEGYSTTPPVVWQTTETNSPYTNSLEIWRGAHTGSGGLAVGAHSGSQHSELNASSNASIYQDMCVLNNETVAWSLWHAARYNNQTNIMRVSISDPNLWTGKTPPSTKIYESPDLSVTSSQGWRQHTGSFVYTGSSGALRFAFEAIQGSFNNITLGNFLDDVALQLPPVVDFLPTNVANNVNLASTIEGDVGNPYYVSLRINGRLSSAATITIPVSGVSAPRSFTVGTPQQGSSTVSGLAASKSGSNITLTVPAGDYDPNNKDQYIHIPVDFGDRITQADDDARFTLSTATGGGSGTFLIGSSACDSARTIVDTRVIDDDLSDYGDAPDTYGTTAANDGARHTVGSNVRLGTAPDSESDASLPLDGSGDGAEDDGITLTTLTEGDTSYTIPAANIDATGSGTLHAWVDFDKSGTFEPGEHTNVDITSGTPDGALIWNGITVGAAGDTYARFRFTSDTSITLNTPGGAASDGEVEDYRIAIAASPAMPPTITKITSTPSVAAGGAANYTITVTNPFSQTLSDVSITDALPAGFTYDAMIGNPVLRNSASRATVVNPTAGSSTPNWGTFTLPPSASVSITFAANTDSNQAVGTYQNPVSITYTDASGSQSASYDPASSTGEDVQITGPVVAPPPPATAPVRSAAGICAIPGKDGPASLGGIINTYYLGEASANAGATSITLGPAATGGGTTGISAGDLLLVIQMQDATINSTDTAAYGSGNTANDGSGQTSMGNSGLYEYVVATNSVGTGGGTLTFTGAASGGAGGLINSYTNANATGSQGQRRFQVVRVPQHSNVTLASTVTALEWNGRTGGLVAADVAGQLNFNGRTIDGVDRGFRGGYSQKNFSGNSTLSYVDTSSTSIGAGKGEGTAGTPRFVWDGTTAVNNGAQGYPNGDYGRGAPSNAGGGGNFHNAGGGGGGNGGVGGNGGLPYAGGFGAGRDSGGRGGALASLFAADPARLFLGGGGGGGDANNATTGVRGGVGGGVVILRSGAITGTGIIDVTGDDGDVGVFGGFPDGAGGGGAGGTVLVAARQNSNTANLSVLANGGAGGNTLRDDSSTSNRLPHGPGAGGGGGVLLHNVPGATLISSVSGGANGRTNGGAGIAHGAQPGQSGQESPFTSSNDPFATVNDDGCLPQLTVWKATTTPGIVQGGLATYKITVSNEPGRTTATDVSIQDVLPTGFTYDSTTSIVLDSGVTRTVSSDPNSGDTTATWGKFDIPSGQKVEITFRAQSSTSIATGTYQNPAVATYLDPKRVNATDTTSSSYDETASTGEDVTVVAPVSSDPNMLLVKRITAIIDDPATPIDRTENPNDNTPLNQVVDDTTSSQAADDNNTAWPAGYLVGALDAGLVQPGDQIEYTVYFLNSGGAALPSAWICDRIIGDQTIVADAYGAGQDIEFQLGTNALQYFTYASDSADRAEYFADSANAPTECALKTVPGGVADNGTWRLEITGSGSTVQGDLATFPSESDAPADDSYYGYVRFQTQVNE